MATAGQAFVVKYTNPVARMLYWRRALQQYARLFDDMEEAVKGSVVDLTATGAAVHDALRGFPAFPAPVAAPPPPSRKRARTPPQQSGTGDVGARG